MQPHKLVEAVRDGDDAKRVNFLNHFHFLQLLSYSTINLLDMAGKIRTEEDAAHTG